jgi:hypothetical protein
MNVKQKRQLLILLVISFIMIVFIAAGLRNLDFQPGMPLPKVINGEIFTSITTSDSPLKISVGDLFKKILGIVLVGCLLYVIYKLLRGISWRDVWSTLWKTLIAIAFFGLIFLILVRSLPQGTDETYQELSVPTSEPLDQSTLGAVPTGIFWVVGILIGAVCILVVFWIVLSAIRHKDMLDEVQQEAERAYREIISGKELNDVIMKCYQQMSIAMEKERGIERKAFMTTGEFEHLLAGNGIPFEPIHQLTTLFDRVRYGNEKPGRNEEKQAIECLTAIVSYCEEIKKGK